MQLCGNLSKANKITTAVTLPETSVEIHVFNSLLFNPAEFKRSFSPFFHIRSSYHQRKTEFTSKLQIEERKNEAKWRALAAKDPGIQGRNHFRDLRDHHVWSTSHDS